MAARKMIDKDCHCPMCGKSFKVSVPESGYRHWQMGELIQRAMPKVDNFTREALISGYCFDCQEKLFGMPKPGNEEAWGEELGDCPCCGAVIWSKHNATNEKDIYKCTSCYSVFNLSEMG